MMFYDILSTSWPGLSRPSTPRFVRKKGVDARHKAGHDEIEAAVLPNALA
jgi:hypothetical protein